jgi:hypothetical protein
VSCGAVEVLELPPDVGAVLGDVVVGVGAGLDGDGPGDVVPLPVGVGVPLVGGGVAAVDPPPEADPEPAEPPSVWEAGGVEAGPDVPEPGVVVPAPVGAGMAPACPRRAGGGVSESHGLRMSTNSSEEPVVGPVLCGEVRRVPLPDVHGATEPRAADRSPIYWLAGGALGAVAVEPDVWVASSGPPLPTIPVPVATVATRIRAAIATVTISAGFLRSGRRCSGICSTSPTCSYRCYRRVTRMAA